MSALTVTCDCTARPVGVVPVKVAVARLAKSLMDDDHQFQVLHADDSVRFRSACRAIDLPKPLVVMSSEWDYIEVPEKERLNFSKRVLFARDQWSCQYCGYQAQPGSRHGLTVDHVKPAHLFESRKAATSYENCVAACHDCNQRKGGKLPMECGMMPNATPKTPSFVQLRFSARNLNPVQRDYVQTYFGEEIA